MTRIGHYEIERPLGAGGMGEVFVAFDTRLERRVALKLLPEASRSAHARTRMLREARAASALKHPAIVTVFEVGDHDGRTFIAMELVDGETFAQMIDRRGALPAAEAVPLVLRVADAIARAHAAGIIHRDIKTANLMLDRDGVARVLDFGLSKRVGGERPVSTPAELPPPSGPDGVATVDERGNAERIERSDTMPIANGAEIAVADTDDALTQHGARLGTAGYAAPEQMRGEQADERSDVFALGVVLFELTCGSLPFPHSGWAELLATIEDGRIPRPSARGADARLDPIVQKALAADPAARFPSVAALIEALTPLVPVATPPASSRRGQVIAGAVAGVAAVGATVAFVALRSSGSSGPPARGRAAGPAVAITTDACALAPDVLADGTIVYSHLAGERMDLFAIPPGGGEARALTDTPVREVRSARGRREGEIVFVISDPAIEDPSKGTRIGILDLATGARDELDIPSVIVTSVAGAIVYVRFDGVEIRRRDGANDSVIAKLPDGLIAASIAASPDGARLAVMTKAELTEPKLCLVTIAGGAVACHALTDALGSRPAWSPDGGAVYYASRAGVRRFEPATGADVEVAAGVIARGGLAITPDGARLLASECSSRGAYHVVDDPAPLTDDEAESAIGGPGGMLAWIRHGSGVHAVMLRTAAGEVRQLTDDTPDQLGDVAFSPDGRSLAYARGGARPGIYTQRLDQTSPPTRMTFDGGEFALAWPRSGAIYFNRFDDQGAPQVHELDLVATAARVIEISPHYIYDGLARTGELLLGDAASSRLALWDPTTGARRTLELSSDVSVLRARITHDGATLIVQAGVVGESVYAFDVATKAHRLLVRNDEGQETPAVLSDRRVVVAPKRYTGKLVAVDAAGGRF